MYRQIINTAIMSLTFSQYLKDNGNEINREKIWYNIKRKEKPIKMKNLHNKSTKNCKQLSI
jgi:hypothetical protein